MAEEKNGPAAVYVAFMTFKNALDQLYQGLPNRIDRTVFPGLSGGVQAQLLTGFRFLELIDDEGKPQPALTALAEADEATRKDMLKSILQACYADLFDLDLTKTTPAELGETMTKSYAVTGNTRDKAVRFFISALEYADIPVSKLFQRRKRGRPPGPVSTSNRKRAARKKVAKRRKPAEENDDSVRGNSTTVSLQSGGTVTLTADVDLFSMNAEDRDFVFGLIDQLRNYGAAENDETAIEEEEVS